MLHVVEFPKPIDRVAQDLEAAVTRHQFRVMGAHDLKQAMAKKEVPFARECRIFGPRSWTRLRDSVPSRRLACIVADGAGHPPVRSAPMPTSR